MGLALISSPLLALGHTIHTSRTGFAYRLTQALDAMSKFSVIFSIGICVVLSATSCKPHQEEPTPALRSSNSDDSVVHPAAQENLPANVRTIIAASRVRTSLGETYDPNYYSIAYPGGDVPNDRGVCTDVVI